LPVSRNVKNVTLLIGKIPENAVGVSGMTMRRRQAGSRMTVAFEMTVRDSANAPASGCSAARAGACFGRFEKRPPQEKGSDPRLARCSVEPPTCLQAQRSCLSYNGGKRERMESLLHDAQNLGIFPAFDPDDTRRL
jgi:hypothetical protein